MGGTRRGALVLGLVALLGSGCGSGEVEAAGPTPLVPIYLAPAGPVVGQVHDTSGQPVAGVDLRLRRGARTVARATSAADGSFELRVDPGLAPGPGAWRAHVEPPVGWDAEPRSLLLDPARPGPLSFWVDPPSPLAPTPGWELRLDLVGPRDLPRVGWRAELFAERSGSWPVPLGLGEFRPGAPPTVHFEALPSAETGTDDGGGLRLVLTREDGLWYGSAGFVAPTEAGASPFVPVIVQGRALVHVAVQGEAVAGRVLGATELNGPAEAWLAAGTPAEGRPEHGAQMLVPKEGRVTLGPLEVGTWLLWLEQDGRTGAPRRVDLEPGVALELWLDGP